METRIITPPLEQAFSCHLTDDEKSKATVQKYLHDIRHFSAFAAGREVSKPLLLEYKAKLSESYAVSSCNSMIASLNALLRFAGWTELRLRQFRVQKKAYCPQSAELSRKEYMQMLCAAERLGKRRLSLLLQTICSSGIRISELRFVTVEAAQTGEATVSCKGKTRTVFLISSLRKKLLRYAKSNGIRSGSIFVTRSGRDLDRSNIWREMKGLCEAAEVCKQKVFPHNLRHLFARTFYAMEKDIAKLADILGHASINTTRVYIITTGEEHRRRMEQMRLLL